MPSSLLLSTTFTASSCTLTSTFANTPFITQPSFKTRTKQAHRFRVSCNASPEDNENQLIQPETQKLILPDNVDRRNLLVGLGGLYTAANIASLPSALASPIMTPDLNSAKCEELTSGIKNYPDALRPRLCRPPKLGKAIKDYELPKDGAVCRMRWPAHDNRDEKTYKENVEKYKLGIHLMRTLDKTNPNHPHSFSQQAKIHCAYCNGGYTQEGFPKMNLQIHNSWLFFPFHRWYLYFYERIIGKLICDNTFALPYWKWDDPAGMTIPEMFIAEKDDSAVFNNKNPIFDKYRDARHLRQQTVNLFFSPNGSELESKRQKACNLSMVYRDLISNGTDWKGFFGGEYVAGKEEPKLQGSVEGNSHTAVHIWVGDSTQPNREDMGNFYSAGYDPLFYVHHANVDRMWKLWKDLKKDFPGHEEPTSDDWLNASYVFYDENEELVRVYNKDCVNLQDLKYDYAESDTPWLKSRPTRREEKSKDLSSATVDVKTVEEALKTPARVDPLLKVRVKRPAKRNVEEKKQEEEKLFITGIKFSTDKFVKFDVFVNDKVDTTRVLPTPCDPEFAGCYAQIPHSGQEESPLGAASFGLNELLEDTKTEDEEYALVALVARAGCEDLTVSGIEIKLVPYNS
ncbi:putative domain, di-copper centre, Polyphenol oxidase [Artemisia annua]|uniref:Putative domain, di-copper centre, Polyphenol oxidase n=1 Tax=Artemisia annua TaxID=35608 RepID=A0A2U1LPB1_ARTAN|nr:putative domain, di-copper centre, Polyphenol oxidase [Artemisia annua]